MISLEKQMKDACLELRKLSGGAHAAVRVEIEQYSQSPEGLFHTNFEVYAAPVGYVRGPSLADAVQKCRDEMQPQNLIQQAESLERTAKTLREKAAARKEGAL